MISMRWKHLLFLHWKVPTEHLRALVPQGLELDTFRDRAYVTLAALSLPELRGEGISGMLGSLSFDEVNLRTYVRGPDGFPGVWFFSLDASSMLAVEGARLFPGLPYFHAEATLREEADGALAFRSERIGPAPLPACVALRYVPLEGPPHMARKGALEHFLLERYALYVKHVGGIAKVRVEHEPYLVRQVRAKVEEQSLAAAAGILLPARPPIAHYVRELAVRARWPEELGSAA